MDFMMENIASIASVIGILITAATLYFTISSFQKQLQLSFFSDYTKRYQEIFLNFPTDINSRNFDLNSFSPDDKSKIIRYMRAYFDLCSEEYYLWRNNSINQQIWSEWESGIKFSFSKPAFKSVWKLLSIDTIYSGEFTEFISGFLDSESNDSLVNSSA